MRWDQTVEGVPEAVEGRETIDTYQRAGLVFAAYEARRRFRNTFSTPLGPGGGSTMCARKSSRFRSGAPIVFRWQMPSQGLAGAGRHHAERTAVLASADATRVDDGLLVGMGSDAHGSFRSVVGCERDMRQNTDLSMAPSVPGCVRFRSVYPGSLWNPQKSSNAIATPCRCRWWTWRGTSACRCS